MLENVQLKYSIALAYDNCFRIIERTGENKNKEHGSVVAPDTEAVKYEGRHHGHSILIHNFD